MADNLSAADNDAYSNVFLRDVLGPPPGQPPGDTRAPKLKLGGALRQHLRRRHNVITVTASCDEPCALAASTSVSFRGVSKRFKLKKVKRSLQANKRAKLRFKLPRKARRAVRRVLSRHKRVTARVRGRATDAAGNASTVSRKIRLLR